MSLTISSKTVAEWDNIKLFKPCVLTDRKLEVYPISHERFRDVSDRNRKEGSSVCGFVLSRHTLWNMKTYQKVVSNSVPNIIIKFYLYNLRYSIIGPSDCVCSFIVCFACFGVRCCLRHFLLKVSLAFQCNNLHF